MNDSINSLHTQDTATMDAPFTEESSVSPYDSAPVSSDQRKSYRYPAQPGRDVATVRAGRTTLKGTLCEESAGGLAIKVAKNCPLKVNDEVEVGIYTGWYRARVVHVQPIDGAHRLGLQRISMISDEPTAPRRKEKSETPAQIRNLVAVALVAMALGIVTTNFIGARFDTGKQVRASVPIYLVDASGDHMQGMLDGVNLLLEPKVAEGLKLSDGQKESIQGILIGASNSLAQSYDESKNKSPEVWYRESQLIVNKALENILCGLTDEQVLKWRAVMLHRRQAS